MYDERFPRERQCAPITPEERGRCLHCAHLGISTGSEYEWPCLILEDWICETHCAEIQLMGYTETRQTVVQQIGWSRAPDSLLEVCAVCPYFDRANGDTIDIHQGLELSAAGRGATGQIER